MKRKWRLRIALVALLGGAAFAGLLWLLYPSHRITREGYDGIRNGFDGMTYAEVVEFLGRPPKYEPGELNEIPLFGTMTSFAMQMEGFIWQSDKGRIYVTFHDGRATGKMFRTGNYEESFKDMVRRWFHLK